MCDETLRAELEGVYRDHRLALDRPDVEAFLGTADIPTEIHGEVRSTFDDVAATLLSVLPALETVEFAGIREHADLAAYYVIIRHPDDPTGVNIGQIVFRRTDAGWRVTRTGNMHGFEPDPDEDVHQQVDRLIDSSDILRLGP